mmetsp:Transcript_26869/g.82655  ORF Transcript_26869/g.82655 Transcript_26869/m.82655 type:complete len:505 (-) Transcript_26869:92-1606(-)
MYRGASPSSGLDALDLLAVLHGLLHLVLRVRAAVLRVVHARVLDLRRDAEDARGLHRAKHERHGGADPRDDHAYAGPGGHERAFGVAAVEDARALVLAVAVIGHAVVVRRREEARRDDAPEAARAVDRHRVDGVVEARGLHAQRRRDVDEAAERADDEGAGRRDDRARGGDRDESGEDAVEDVVRVDDVLHEVADERRRHAPRRRAERRRDGDVRGGLRVAVDVERRDAIEAVPAHPEDEDAEGLEHGLALGQIVREALARADHDARDERGDAARHVDRARAGEVDDAAFAEEPRARAPRGELARAPHHVDDGRVHEADEDDGVERVGHERRAFGDAARDDGAARGREREAEEPRGFGVGRLVRRGRRHEEAAVAREAADALAREVVAVGARERRAGRPPHDGADAGVEEVLDEDVLHVLLGDGPDLEHGEAGLHPEDEDAAEEEPKRVDVARGNGVQRRLRGGGLKVAGAEDVLELVDLRLERGHRRSEGVDSLRGHGGLRCG